MGQYYYCAVINENKKYYLGKENNVRLTLPFLLN